MVKKPGDLDTEQFKETVKKTEAVQEVQTSAMNNPLFKMHPTEFSGIARSVECYNNQGNNNFRVLTLYIDKGKISKIEVSDPFAQWEAGQKIDHWNDLALINLNNNWKHGKTLCK